MKRKITFLLSALFALTLITNPLTMLAQAGYGQTLWSETWTGGTTGTPGETPSAYGFEGTTVYGGATLTYAQSSSNTGLYNEKLAGGTAPELLLSKSNQTWTISNIPTGDALGMSLTFLSNKSTFTVTSSTTGITVSGSGTSWTFTQNSTSIKNFSITIKNTGSQNARIDNVSLTASKVQLPTPTNVSASPGNAEATISWSAVANASSYTLSYKTSASDAWTDITGITGTSRTITSLTNNTTYDVKVKAVGNNTTYTDSNYSGVQTVTPTAATYYSITISSPITGGSVIASHVSATAGTQITLTPSPDDCYSFTSWDVRDGSLVEVDVDNNNKFYMPSSNVTVNATFSQIHYTISYSVNGTIENDLDDNVTCGNNAHLWDAEKLEAEGITLPTGYSLAGWSTSASSTTRIDSYTPEDDATLYAVLSHTESGVLVDNVVILDGEATGLSSDILSNETTITESDISYKAKGIKYYSVQAGATNAFETSHKTIFGGKDAAVYIYNSAAFGEGITKFEIYSNYGASTSVTVGVNFGATQITSYNSSADNTWSQTLSTANHVYDCSSAIPSGAKYFCFGIAKDKNAQVQFRITYSTIGSRTTYYTHVQEVPKGLSYIENITPGDLVIVPKDAVLEITGSCTGTADNLVIEDGGKLITSSSVPATVKKSISAPLSKVYGWYTISSPVHTGSNAYVTIGTETTVNLTTGSHDMFAYDEENATWLNQQASSTPGHTAAGFDKMYAGQGYMYRSSDNTISFVGNTNYDAVDCALSCSGPGKLKGFNLIGNPYTHSIAKGSGKAIDNSKLSTGCYALTNSGTWTPITDGNEILPEQGILVEVSEAVADFQIQDIIYSGGGGGKYHNDNIMFTISNNSYEDVAYAWFDKGIGLTKINHRDENAPMIYIPQEGRNCAIATMSDDTKVFGLNFKAATMGQYTLSYKADGNFDYLHIIDRLTGEDIDMLLEGQYTFVATPNDNDNRFIVNLAYKPDYGEGNNENFAYQSGNEILVSGSGELQIFDVTGRSVMTTTINGVESINIPTQGVYIFRLNEKVQKIVVR